jgi:organic hydroperoxide reductase OsmC/OhrA
MKISAHIQNGKGKHEITLQTNDAIQSIKIPPKSNGFGSTVNGGELLFLALATCYCNDIYREAAKRSIKVTEVEVMVEGEFGSDGEPARNVAYSAKVKADASTKDIEELMRETDKMAEIPNTLRVATPVTFKIMD